MKLLEDKVRAALREKGVLTDKREVIVERFGVGARASIIEARSGRTTVQIATVTADTLRGKLRDQVNGLVGGLMAKLIGAV